MSVNRLLLGQPATPPSAARSVARGFSLVLSLVAIVAVVLLARGWRPTATSANTSHADVGAMPVSAAIEAKYGIRFTSVDVTAGGGMIQLQYQILDSDKSNAVHDATSAPFVVDANGNKYADPGMVGHTHVGKTKVAGRTDYILLADARGGVKSGSVVTVKIGDLELRNIHVL